MSLVIVSVVLLLCFCVSNVTFTCFWLCTGLLATVTILANGIWQMRTGDQMKSQRMMRLRILAQGFTVAALVGGIYATAKKEKKE